MRIRRNEGYSLIELMIVVVIIGILAALAIPKFLDSTRKSKEAEGKMLAKSAYTMVHSYIVLNDACPADLPTAGFAEILGKYYSLDVTCAAIDNWSITATPLDAALGLVTWTIDQNGDF